MVFSYKTLLLASYKGELGLLKGNLALPWEWYNVRLQNLNDEKNILDKRLSRLDLQSAR